MHRLWGGTGGEGEGEGEGDGGGLTASVCTTELGEGAGQEGTEGTAGIWSEGEGELGERERADSPVSEASLRSPSPLPASPPRPHGRVKVERVVERMEVRCSGAGQVMTVRKGAVQGRAGEGEGLEKARERTKKAEEEKKRRLRAVSARMREDQRRADMLHTKRAAQEAAAVAVRQVVRPKPRMRATRPAVKVGEAAKGKVREDGKRRVEEAVSPVSPLVRRPLREAEWGHGGGGVREVVVRVDDTRSECETEGRRAAVQRRMKEKMEEKRGKGRASTSTPAAPPPPPPPPQASTPPSHSAAVPPLVSASSPATVAAAAVGPTMLSLCMAALVQSLSPLTPALSPLLEESNQQAVQWLQRLMLQALHSAAIAAPSLMTSTALPLPPSAATTQLNTPSASSTPHPGVEQQRGGSIQPVAAAAPAPSDQAQPASEASQATLPPSRPLPAVESPHRACETPTRRAGSEGVQEAEMSASASCVHREGEEDEVEEGAEGEEKYPDSAPPSPRPPHPSFSSPPVPMVEQTPEDARGEEEQAVISVPSPAPSHRSLSSLSTTLSSSSSESAFELSPLLPSSRPQPTQTMSPTTSTLSASSLSSTLSGGSRLSGPAASYLLDIPRSSEPLTHTHSDRSDADGDSSDEEEALFAKYTQPHPTPTRRGHTHSRV